MAIVHLGLHFIIPALASRFLFSKRWKSAWLVMMAAMIIDLDHLWADPMFDPNRCSINFHPFHSFPAIAIYGMLAVIPKTRLIGLGLVIHLMVDMLDCL